MNETNRTPSIVTALEKCETEIAWALAAFEAFKADQGDRGNCYFQLQCAVLKARAALAIARGEAVQE